MLVSYHRMGLEVMPGKQVTFVIILHSLFSRQKNHVLNTANQTVAENNIVLLECKEIMK